jgi:hypothetical protein
LDDIYTFLVRGPSSRYPRGYISLVPVWFAILGAAVVFASRRMSGHLPLWLGATELGGLLLACLVLCGVLGTVRRHAFRVSSSGIWLGVRTTRKRPKLRQVHISWADVAQVRMVPRRYGTLLEISLGPAARIVPRLTLGQQCLLLLGALVMPVGFGRGRPALTAARADPPRYLVKVCDATPADIRMVLAELKPPALGVRVLPKAGALRFASLPRQRSSPQRTGAALPH